MFNKVDAYDLYIKSKFLFLSGFLKEGKNLTIVLK